MYISGGIIMINQGKDFEDELCKALNKKKIGSLNQNLQHFIRHLFPEANFHQKIMCELTDNYVKPDIIITWKRRVARVSIKTGQASTLHGEDIKPFILFLRSIGVSTETQKTILYYQFGDGTLDGSGEKRMNYHDVYNWLEERIAKANQELNDRFEIIEKVVERVVFQGVNPTADPADYVYYGDLDYGVVISRKQIMSHIKKKSWNYFDNLHIGPILLKAHARYAERQIVSDARRRKITCYWSHFAEDMAYIDKRYTF